MQSELPQYSSQLIVLFSELVWPATLLIILFNLRESAKKLLESFSSRIQDPNSDISIGKEGVEIRARLEAVEIDQEQTKLLTLQALGVAEDFPESTTPISSDLLALADEYLQVNDPDWTTRLRQKDNLALKMVELAIKENVSRVELARKDNEGLLLALAALSHMFPKLSDAELLIDIAKKSRRLNSHGLRA